MKRSSCIEACLLMLLLPAFLWAQASDCPCESCYPDSASGITANFQDGLTLDAMACPITRSLAGTFSVFVGIEGSKQPQDFGVNANVGGRASVDYAMPLIANRGIGLQLGTALVASGNAVQVFELLGETDSRIQSYTTVGIFQRARNGFSAGAVYDFLYQDSFDQFQLGQWRLRAAYDFSPRLEVGTTFHIGSRADDGRFNSTTVELEPIDMLNVYVGQRWESGVSTKYWVGVADGHGETNAVTGDAPRKNNQFLFGAEILAPLNSCLAIYGETNLMMPADTGAVDAYLGVQLTPGGISRRSWRNRFRPMLPVASSASFANDLRLRN